MAGHAHAQEWASTCTCGASSGKELFYLLIDNSGHGFNSSSVYRAVKEKMPKKTHPLIYFNELECTQRKALDCTALCKTTGETMIRAATQNTRVIESLLKPNCVVFDGTSSFCVPFQKPNNIGVWVKSLVKKLGFGGAAQVKLDFSNPSIKIAQQQLREIFVEHKIAWAMVLISASFAAFGGIKVIEAFLSGGSLAFEPVSLVMLLLVINAIAIKAGMKTINTELENTEMAHVNLQMENGYVQGEVVIDNTPLHVTFATEKTEFTAKDEQTNSTCSLPTDENVTLNAIECLDE